MCLAVPMKIITKEGFSATVEADGVSREINLRLLEDAQVGDYVLVHAGFAIEKIDEQEAKETLELMQQIFRFQGKMKFIDEFRNADIARELSNKIHITLERIGQPVALMEVCGTHTMAIYRHGIKSILPLALKLLSGPGCPVCVTPNRYLDYAIALSRQDGVIITTFGDMLNVPGSSTSLVRERASGADIRTVYSPLDALAIAQKNPDNKIIFLAVGFETTSPTIAGTIIEAQQRNVSNFFISCAHKRIPPAMQLLVEDPELHIDGFICPAHVSAIIGSAAYEFRQTTMPSPA